MRKKILVGWCCIHLLFIFLVNLSSSFIVYNEFHHKKYTPAPIKAISSFFNLTPCKYYGRYTGAETGYGFFGINVRSNGLLLGECGGQKLSPEFLSYETSLRFFSMASAVTDEYLEPLSGSDSAKASASTGNDYHNLVLKNIAVTLFQKNNCADTSVLLSYNLISFPTIAEIRHGIPKKYELNKLVMLRFGLR